MSVEKVVRYKVGKLEFESLTDATEQSARNDAQDASVVLLPYIRRFYKSSVWGKDDADGADDWAHDAVIRFAGVLLAKCGVTDETAAVHLGGHEA